MSRVKSAVCLLSSIVFLICGCSPIVKSTQYSETNPKKKHFGIPYYLPKGWIRIKLSPNATANSKAYDLTTETILMPSDYMYMLDYNPSAWSEDNINLTVVDGLLQTVDVDSDDKSGDVAIKLGDLVKQAILLGAGAPAPVEALQALDGEKKEPEYGYVDKLFDPEELLLKNDTIKINKAIVTIHLEALTTIKTHKYSNDNIPVDAGGVYFRPMRPYLLKLTSKKTNFQDKETVLKLKDELKKATDRLKTATSALEEAKEVVFHTVGQLNKINEKIKITDDGQEKESLVQSKKIIEELLAKAQEEFNNKKKAVDEAENDVKTKEKKLKDATNGSNISDATSAGIIIEDGFEISRVVYLPNFSPILSYDAPRAPFVKYETNFGFDKGVLTDVTIKKPSEMLEGIAIPATLAKSLLSIPAEIVKLKFDYNSKVEEMNSAERESLKQSIETLKEINSYYTEQNTAYIEQLNTLKAIIDARGQ